MTLQSVRDLLTLRPFRPFRLIMSSGHSYEVSHPEMVMLTRSDMLVGVGGSDDGIPAEFRICPLLHIATTEPLSVSRPTS